MTMPSLTAAELARARQAMMLGLARQPFATPAALAPLVAAAEPEPGLDRGPDADPARLTLVLAAQRQRFERPAGIASTAVPVARQMHADARPILPPPARRALARLSNAVAKGETAQVLQTAVRRVVAAGFRPHPFDLPWLMPHIKPSPACLGLAERAFLALSEKPEAGERPRTGILHAEITTANWTDFPRGHRRDLLARQRAADPAAARALLESVFKTEPAPVRAELLHALAVRLSLADQPFLEGLAGDRADSVKQVAARLLAQVPGTPAHAARLAAAAACFQKPAGVASLIARIGIGNAGEVTFVPPKAAKTEAGGALWKLFNGLSLDALARATGLPGPQILDALPEDDVVFNCLVETAVTDADAAAQALLFEHKVRAVAAETGARFVTLAAISAHAPAQMSLALAETVLASPGFARVAEALNTSGTATPKDDGTLLALAGLMPAEAMPRYLAALEPLPMAATREARAFAELVLALAAPLPAEPATHKPKPANT